MSAARHTPENTLTQCGVRRKYYPGVFFGRADNIKFFCHHLTDDEDTKSYNPNGMADVWPIAIDAIKTMIAMDRVAWIINRTFARSESTGVSPTPNCVLPQNPRNI